MTNTPLLHQWTQLESSGCIENFRVAAGLSRGVHRGWFFADSDAHKWLDAAGRMLTRWNVSLLEDSNVSTRQRENVQSLVENFIELLSRAQAPDGYLYTYNQIHFPASRWENLLIEHELYCHGHFIEACLSCHEAGLGGGLPLDMARRAADLLVRDFLHTSRRPDGHEEIEIALLRLYEATGHAPYRDLAAALLERRGRGSRLRFALDLLRENARVERRRRLVEAARRAWDEAHPEAPRYVLPPGNPVKAPRSAALRWKISALSGQYFQMHAPLERQTVPVGHAVRFGYLMTAAARLLRLQSGVPASPDQREGRSNPRADEEIASPPAAARNDTQPAESREDVKPGLNVIASPDQREGRSNPLVNAEIASPPEAARNDTQPAASRNDIQPAAARNDTKDRARLTAMQRAWERMVSRRMYVTGGLGAVPGLEGFGRDDELDPEYAYAETCAALASLFWNWEMALLTGEAKYSDLFEWQWYNAARPGLGLDGTTYLYNNPLASRGGITRRPWYAVPCCPSNLLRTMAWLDRYAVHVAGDEVWVHQYVDGGRWTIDGGRWTIDGGRPTIDGHGQQSIVHGLLSIVHGLPWEGRVRIRLDLPAPSALTLRLRLPSWAGSTSLLLNGEPLPLGTSDYQTSNYQTSDSPTADYPTLLPHASLFLPLRRTWSPGDTLDLSFATPIRLLRARPQVRPCRGKVAVTRGPLVYCLESVDNPDVDLFSVRLDPSTLASEFRPTLLGGTQVITARSRDGRLLTFIPYYLWANRGESQMTVWVNV